MNKKRIILSIIVLMLLITVGIYKINIETNYKNKTAEKISNQNSTKKTINKKETINKKSKKEEIKKENENKEASSKQLAKEEKQNDLQKNEKSSSQQANQDNSQKISQGNSQKVTQNNSQTSTSTAHTKTQAEINNEKRVNLENTYGVKITYKSEMNNYYVPGYGYPTQLTDDNQISRILNEIDTGLKKYPSGFFYEIKNNYKQVNLYLVSNLGNSYSGLTNNSGSQTITTLATEGYLFEHTMHHELMHYIDCYLANKIGAWNLENSMINLNPKDFNYGAVNNNYIQNNNSLENTYFLSAYSQTSYMEDRAVLFSDMMTRTYKKSYYSVNCPVNTKAKLISNQLSTYISAVQRSTYKHWDRMIA